MMTQENVRKALINVLFFTSPVLAIFFGQLAIGVPVQKAYPLALYALYALLADLFKKMKETGTQQTPKP